MRWYIILNTRNEKGQYFCNTKKMWCVHSEKFADEAAALKFVSMNYYIPQECLQVFEGRYAYQNGKIISGVIYGSATFFDLLYNGKVIKENQKAGYLNSHKQSLISTGFYNKNRFLFSPRG